MTTRRLEVNRPGFLLPGGPVLAMALVAALLGPSCKGNVNDDSVGIIDLRFMSVSTGGTPADNGASDASISENGQFVAFSTQGTNLDPIDSNTTEDIYLRDSVANVTYLVSINTTGTGSGNDFSSEPVVSPDGRFVAWKSRATNLVTGVTDSSFTEDAFVRDMQAGVTVPVSVNSAETAMVGLSFSSRLAISSDSTNVYVAFASNNTTIVTVPTVTGFADNVYVRRIPILTFSTISSGTTVLVSQNTANNNGGNSSSRNPSMGQDAANLYVVFDTQATDLHPNDGSGTEDIHYRSVNKTTLALGAPILVSVNIVGPGGGNGNSRLPDISADGAFVSFESAATDLLAPLADTNGFIDIFVRGDLISGPVSTTRVSVSDSGGQLSDDSQVARIDRSGQFVVFESNAQDVVPGDTNGATDVFLHDRSTGTTQRVSLTIFGAQPAGDSFQADIGGNREVTFRGPGNLIPGPLTFESQVFKRRM